MRTYTHAERAASRNAINAARQLERAGQYGIRANDAAEAYKKAKAENDRVFGVWP